MGSIRLPLIPTLMVLAAIPVLIALGMWQLDRLEWKEALIAQHAEAPALPSIDLDEPGTAPASFRRASISCSVVGDPIAVGRTNRGRPGYSFRLPCTSDTSGNSVTLDLGWGPRPDIVSGAALRSTYSGTLVAMDDVEDRFLLTPGRAVLPALEPSEVPSPETIPNNHRTYAVQWFLFAGILTVIYAVYLRGWRRRVAAKAVGG